VAAGDQCRIAMEPQLGWHSANGNVLGVYLHGLFEDPAVLTRLFGASTPTLETVFEGLADFVERHFAPGVLAGLIR
jgi:adenosylcobyric acid synthase